MADELFQERYLQNLHCWILQLVPLMEGSHGEHPRLETDKETISLDAMPQGARLLILEC